VPILPQSALRHRPGKWGAVAIWRRHSNCNDASLRAGLVALLELPRPTGATLLVAAAPSVVGLESSWLGGPFAPRTQGQVFLQATADERAPLLVLLRAATHILGGRCDLDEELIGGKIGDGREPFGFRDSVKAPTLEERHELVGPEGVTTLLYLRFEQHLDRFGAQPVATREAAMGQRLDGDPLTVSGSHRDRFQTKKDIVRRGFPYRHCGEEGLAFVAAAAAAQPLRAAWQHFEGDPLRPFVTPLSSGFYVAPPDAAWVKTR